MRVRSPKKIDNYNCLFSHAIIQREKMSALPSLKYGQHNMQNSNGIQICSDLTIKSDNYNCLFSHAIIQRGNQLFSVLSASKYVQHNRQNINGIQIWPALPDAPHCVNTRRISDKARASTRTKEYDVSRTMHL